MRLLRPACVLLVACSACNEPSGPRRPSSSSPWYSGQWRLVDSTVVDYALSNYAGLGTTVTFNVADTRSGMLRLSPMGRDSIEVVSQGAGRRVVRSSAAPDVEWDQSFDFTDTLYAPSGFIVGMYMTGPDDSLPMPAEPADSIYWIADTLAVCRSWRLGMADPANGLVPGSFACRQRIRWQRP